MLPIQLRPIAAFQIPQFPLRVGKEDFTMVPTGPFVLQHQPVGRRTTDGGHELSLQTHGIAPRSAIPRQQKGIGVGTDLVRAGPVCCTRLHQTILRERAISSL
jgi:hypothetical protein